MEIESLIGSYAFPIVVCLWFMFRQEKISKQLTIAIENLKDAIMLMKK